MPSIFPLLLSLSISLFSFEWLLLGKGHQEEGHPRPLQESMGDTPALLNPTPPGSGIRQDAAGPALPPGREVRIKHPLFIKEN